MFTLLPLISTTFIVISAICIAVGWVYIRRRNIAVHKKWMLAGALFALAFFIIYVTRTALLGNMTFNGPESVKVYYHIFLVFHIILSTVGGIFGLVTLFFAFTERFAKHRKIGPWTAVIWFCTAVTGVAVYLLLFVLYPGGETDSLLKAILGL